MDLTKLSIFGSAKIDLDEELDTLFDDEEIEEEPQNTEQGQANPSEAHETQENEREAEDVINRPPPASLRPKDIIERPKPLPLNQARAQQAQQSTQAQQPQTVQLAQPKPLSQTEQPTIKLAQPAQ